MKKLFALALAATMAAGMTTVAFAAQDQAYIAKGTEYYKLDSDNRAKDVNGAEEFEGGTKLVIPVSAWVDENEDDIQDVGEYGYLTYASDYDRRLVVEDVWKVGEPAEVTTGFVDYSEVTDKELSTGDSEIMSVIITLPENVTTKVEDLAGTVQVGRSSSTAKKSPVFKLDVSYYSMDKVTSFDGGELTSADTGIVSFEQYEGEIDMDFEDFATFTVNIDGQGKVNLAWDTYFNEEFGAMYDYANLWFLNFEGTPSFNKTGTMMIYAEPDTFIYEVTADGAKSLDATYDEDYEAWTFKTRTLASYVVSDVELTEKTVTDTEDDTTDDGSKPIPDTGR